MHKTPSVKAAGGSGDPAPALCVRPSSSSHEIASSSSATHLLETGRAIGAAGCRTCAQSRRCERQSWRAATSHRDRVVAPRWTSHPTAHLAGSRPAAHTLEGAEHPLLREVGEGTWVGEPGGGAATPCTGNVAWKGGHGRPGSSALAWCVPSFVASTQGKSACVGIDQTHQLSRVACTST